MARPRWPVELALGLVLVLSAAWWSAGQLGPAAAPAPAPATAKPPTVEEALLRPARLPFARPTPLSAVVATLRDLLKAPVVLDKAALDRMELTPEDTVELELDGVRLKTALPLLLDQLGLTYRVEPEDNLLVITDREGAEDRVDRILTEIERLHDDVHDLQDSVDAIREDLAPVEILSDPAMPADPNAPAPAPEAEGPAPAPGAARHGRAG
jgi:hypothetical protein